jgi:hypothetical protein
MQHLCTADEPPSILQDWMGIVESCVVDKSTLQDYGAGLESKTPY